MGCVLFLFDSLPVVCAEWEWRQSTCICHVAELEVLETIAQGNRLLYLRAYHGDTFIPRVVAWLPEMAGCSRMEHFVLACNLESLDVVEAVVGTKSVVS